MSLLSSDQRSPLTGSHSTPEPAGAAIRPDALLRNRETAGSGTQNSVTALVMLNLGLVAVPVTTAPRVQAPSQPIRIGTVLVGDTVIDPAAAPSRLVYRDTVAIPREPNPVYVLYLTGRNIGAGAVPWFAGIEISHLGYSAKNAVVSLSTTGGDTWSSPLPMEDVKNPAFCLLQQLAPGESQDLLLRVSFLSLTATDCSAVALGLTVDTTVVQTREPRPERARHGRRPLSSRAVHSRTSAPRLPAR